MSFAGENGDLAARASACVLSPRGLVDVTFNLPLVIVGLPLVRRGAVLIASDAFQHFGNAGFSLFTLVA